MSVQLHQGQRSLGSLNLYSGHASSFAGDDAQSALPLATHLSLAMAAATTREQLEVALASRVTIGEAKGMLMERYDLDEDQAFDVLVRASQHTNRKLISIATDLVFNGIEPGVLGA